jgi:hypothetical protein
LKLGPEPVLREGFTTSCPPKDAIDLGVRVIASYVLAELEEMPQIVICDTSERFLFDLLAHFEHGFEVRM